MSARGSVTSCGTWIGPALARTGRHHDLLDNLAVQIAGRKRFCLACADTDERAGALRATCDAWARLSRGGIAELVAGDPAAGVDFFAVTSGWPRLGAVRLGARVAQWVVGGEGRRRRPFGPGFCLADGSAEAG
ncbi:hypothetical protein G3I77_29645 [Streptomyces sp. D2-8]|uniref:cupin-like domain-containing protein n=1 Tax=Streptomyces sp. D2-8 TaxID=2707767 RepID=UPI0020BD8F13|nr:cupin-like domain-containing protein [Streptomyces sp. D2-8]MCK8437013.1 hypothetical protein [Streptomyces sp. D2-8]